MEKNLPNFKNFRIPRWSELPNVDLYLDQVVNFINSSLSTYYNTDEKEENQLLTKTMINNYVKNNIINAPVKKQYSKIQVAKLIVICVLKQVYSMQEIKILIKIALKYGTDEQTYDNFCNLFEEALDCTFNKREFKHKNSNNSSLYLMKSILLSCSYKIYTQTILSKRKNKKS